MHESDRKLLNRLLEEAVQQSQEEAVMILLDAGAAIDLHFASGSTALYDAALKGDERMVSLLASRGANVDEGEGTSLTTPLNPAAAFGREEVVMTLWLWGADPNLVGRERMTPLHAAESNHYRKITGKIRTAGGR